MTNAIVVICRWPLHSELCAFYQSIDTYDVYMVVPEDTETEMLDTFRTTYSNIHFEMVSDMDCIASHTHNCESTSILKKDIGIWDRAMCLAFKPHFSSYPFIWFLEDAVFFNNLCCLQDADTKFNSVDLLANVAFDKPLVDDEIEWSKIEIQLNGPYYQGLLYGCRLSKTALCNIFEYSVQHKTLFSHEILWPTLASKKQWNVLQTVPSELKTITIRDRFKFPAEFNKCGFFHPMIHPEHHTMIRDYYNDPSIIQGFPVYRPSDYPMVVFR